MRWTPRSQWTPRSEWKPRSQWKPRSRLLVILAVIAATVAMPTSPAAGHDASGFDDTRILVLTQPTDLDWTPDGRMLIAEKAGRVLVVENDAVTGTALDISSIVCGGGERGIVGLTVHPDFAINGFVYLYYTYAKHGNCGTDLVTGPANRVARFTMVGNTLDAASELVLLEGPELDRTNHNAGALGFGNDGYLYIATGDAARPRPLGLPRDPANLLGKILRVTDDGDIPNTNPFTGPGTADCSAAGVIPAGSTATACQQVFALGLRNPFRVAFDPNTTDTRFYINDVGQNRWEEIDEGAMGADYGWPEREGPCAFGSTTNCAVPTGAVDPIHWYPHVGGAAITGGAFVPNGIWPAEYDNTYIYGDFVDDRLYVMEPGGADCRTCTPPTSPFLDHVFAENADNVSAIAFGPFGDTQALYGLFGNRVHRISYTGDANRAPTAVATASPRAGTLPLQVSFTGSASSDPDGDPLSYLWDFGDGGGSNEANPTHTYTGSGTVTATLWVSDGQGGTDQTTVRIDPGNSPPTPTIITPTVSTTFGVGEILTLTGSAVDAEDGTLGAADLTWEVRQHHGGHVHPFLAPTSGNGLTIAGPPPEDTLAATNSYLEVLLTATDSGGVSTTVSVDVQPRTRTIDFVTVPPGLELVVDGITVTAPHSVTAWDGQQLDIAAPATQPLGGVTQYWHSWAPTGAATRTIDIGANDTTFTANYAATPRPTAVPGGIVDIEGTGGVQGYTPMAVPITLSAASPFPVTIDWVTLDSTATAPDDYIEQAGTITLAAGERTGYAVVDVVADADIEPRETFVVSFRNPSGAAMGGVWGLGLGVIINDDAF